MPPAGKVPGSWKVALPVICLTALCVVLPFLHYGIPSGHDFEFHMNSWMDVVDHWKQGVAYPHWEAMAHSGYGEARFIFYPPLSWTLGALLGLVLPWKLVPAAYVWIVLTLSGCSMFILARRSLPGSGAIWAAVFYAANPYHLVIVYWRSAFAELLAAVYLPLLLLLILELEARARAIVPLSLLLAAGWLTNLPSAVMMNYSVAVLLLCGAGALAREKHSGKHLYQSHLGTSPRIILAHAAFACVIGAALAGFFLVPAFHEQSWVNISQVLAPGVRPQDNFLFTFSDDLDHNRFNLLVSIVAVSEIVAVGAFLFLARRVSQRRLWWLLLSWSALAAVLMLKPTLPLWTHLPELRFAQLPWRWLLCLNVPLALAIPLAFGRWWTRGLMCLGALAMVLLLWHRLLVPWWDTAADVQEMLDNQHEGIGNEGADEYVPAGVDPYDADKNAPLARFDGNGKAHIVVETWEAESKTVRANSTSAGSVVLRLFNYPLWQVTVNRRPAPTASAETTGQIIIPIAAGENRVRIFFQMGADRTVGFAISLLAGIMIVLISLRLSLGGTVR